MIKESFDGVLLRGFQKNFKEVTGCSKSNPMAFQLSFMKIPKVFQSISKVFKGGFKGASGKISRVF